MVKPMTDKRLEFLERHGKELKGLHDMRLQECIREIRRLRAENERQEEEENA